MKTLNKKTRKAVKKAIRKSLDQHGFATGLVTGAVAAYALHASGATNRFGEMIGEALPRLAENPGVQRAMGAISSVAHAAGGLFHDEANGSETKAAKGERGNVARERQPRRSAPETRKT